MAFIRERIAHLKQELLVETPYFVLPAGAQATVKALHERNVRVRVLTNSLASNDMLPAHSGYAKTRRRLLSRTAWSSIRAAPGYRRFPAGLVARFRAVASGLACQGHGFRW